MADAPPLATPAEPLAPPLTAVAPPAVRVETVVGDLNHPWAVAFLPDGTLLITERRGRLQTVCHRILAEAVLPIGARVRDLRVGPEGLIYLLTDQSDGQLLRLVPSDERKGERPLSGTAEPNPMASR